MNRRGTGWSQSTGSIFGGARWIRRGGCRGAGSSRCCVTSSAVAGLEGERTRLRRKSVVRLEVLLPRRIRVFFGPSMSLGSRFRIRRTCLMDLGCEGDVPSVASSAYIVEEFIIYKVVSKRLKFDMKCARSSRQRVPSIHAQVFSFCSTGAQNNTNIHPIITIPLLFPLHLLFLPFLIKHQRFLRAALIGDLDPM